MSKFLKGVELFENETEEQGYLIPCLTGEGAPGLTQEGAVGSLYFDEISKNIYKCVGVDGNGYQWVKETATTPGDIGAAPAGYGLGGLANENSVSDVNAAVKCGYYHVPMGVLNTPTGFGEGVLHVLARGNGEYVQELFSAIHNWKCRRKTIGGIDGWGEWEWVNPPMWLGVEYRTTERLNGKAVYTKAIECGALGANSIDDVSHNTANIEAVWVSGGYWFDGTLYYSLPYFGTSDNQVLVSTYASVIHRQLLGSAYNIQGMVVVLKYTKTTG